MFQKVLVWHIWLYHKCKTNVQWLFLLLRAVRKGTDWMPEEEKWGWGRFQADFSHCPPKHCGKNGHSLSLASGWNWTDERQTSTLPHSYFECGLSKGVWMHEICLRKPDKCAFHIFVFVDYKLYTSDCVFLRFRDRYKHWHVWIYASKWTVWHTCVLIRLSVYVF